jgi:hypothetical protein
MFLNANAEPLEPVELVLSAELLTLWIMPLLIPEPVDFALTFDLRILQVFTFDHVDFVGAELF